MQPAEQTLATPSGTLHYWVSRAESGRPWLVFLPGLTADHTLFEKQMEAFGPAYNCLVWDPPAHGASRPFALTFSMEQMAEYLYTILQKEVWQAEPCARLVLVGQSMGGYLAQVYLTLHPQGVSGFVSVDSCSLGRSYFTWAELALLKRTKWMYLSIPWRWLIGWGSRGTAQTQYGQALMRRMMQSYQKTEYCLLADHGYRIVAQAVEAGKDYRPPCPVLLLCGEKDAAGSARRYNKCWTAKEGHPLVWVPGAGHNSNTDEPELVNREIDQFVSSLR